MPQILKVVAVLLIVLAAVVLMAWLRPDPSADPAIVEPPPLPSGVDRGESAIVPAAALAAVERLNVGIGHAENNQLSDAMADFQSLTSDFPNEIAPWQNLLVVQVLSLSGANSATVDESAQRVIAEAIDTLTTLQTLQPESLATNVLAARLAAVHDPSVAVGRLQAAALAAPDDLPTWFEQYTLTQYATDEPTQLLSQAALQRAFEIAPTNLVVLLERLQSQVAAEDTTLVDTLEAGATRWEQLWQPIQGRVRVDIRELVSAARQAVTDGNWSLVRRNVLLLKNVVTPEEATRSDRRLVERHALEFLIDEFSPSVMEQARRSGEGFAAAAIAFAPSSDTWRMATPAPVRDIVAGDFDLDTQTDIACLLEDRLMIFRRESDRFVTLAEHPVMADLSHVIAVDLDDDVSEAPPPAAAPADAAGQGPTVPEAAGHPAVSPVDCHRADLDFILYGPGGVVALQNQRADSGRRLMPLSLSDELSQREDVRQVLAVDLDMDGDLDLLTISAAGVEPWLNRGNLSFASDGLSFFAVPADRTIVAASAVDWDEDIDTDLILLDAAGGLGLLENLRHGEFQWRAIESPPAVQATSRFAPESRPQRSTTVRSGLSGSEEIPMGAVEPLDAGGRWDLLLSGEGGLVRLVRDRLEGSTDQTPVMSLSSRSFANARTADLNNDGWLDVVCVSGNGLAMVPGPLADLSTALEAEAANDPAVEVDLGLVAPGLPSPSSVEPRRPAACLELVDVNADGLLDLVMGQAEGAEVHLNNTSTEAGWIEVSLVAEQIKGGDLSASGRVNHYGIGSTVEVRIGPRRLRQIVRSPVVHFGLGAASRVASESSPHRSATAGSQGAGAEQTPQGAAARADTVRVLWTNGVPENVIQPPPRMILCERQTLKGSCPYVYGWDGARFAFITDLLWASPIGLVGPSGQLVPSRPWEYLKIDGDQLQTRDGRYELRLTEELWEAAYFDSVKLYVIDHPIGTDVFTNEKVGPPAIAEHRLHVVRTRRVPRAATDQAGRNVLPLIRDPDEEYVRLFDRKVRQGYTTGAELTLDLGDLREAKQITLFLTGWIYPTDTTINVALSQNPDLAGPAPLSLAVPNANGEWETVLPFTGFPGGKTKTIAIDLSGRFLTDDYRVRLSTDLELYWDAIFFTTDEAPPESEPRELTMLSAELRSRGVSAAIPHEGYGPERYDYERVSPSPWLPMDGQLTRFGDVRELLIADDSRLVVMGSGDEVALSFEAAAPPPSGWTRDFILRNVGWDKDADLHTVYGQTIEPLPFLDMSSYPWPLEEAPPESASYEQYLESMQTRPARARP